MGSDKSRRFRAWSQKDNLLRHRAAEGRTLKSCPFFLLLPALQPGGNRWAINLIISSLDQTVRIVSNFSWEWSLSLPLLCLCPSTSFLPIGYSVLYPTWVILFPNLCFIQEDEFWSQVQCVSCTFLAPPLFPVEKTSPSSDPETLMSSLAPTGKLRLASISRSRGLAD